LDAAVVTARIKEGSVELHSMHFSAQVREEIEKLALQALANSGEENLPDKKLTCSKCKLDYEHNPKSTHTKVCSSCHSKRMLFTQMFGHWPIDSFMELSAESQTLVWQGANTKLQLQNSLANVMTNQKIDEEETKNEGSYMPLTCYAALGYKTDVMETTCPKKWDLELKLWTYKKTITADRKSEIAKKCKEDLAHLRAPGLRSRLSHYASPIKRKRNRSKSQSSDSSSNSNSSTSSVDSKVNDSPRTLIANAAKEAMEAAKNEKIEKAKATIAAKAARVEGVKQAKENKAREAAAIKKAAKDPILISMHMHRDILV
jgi:hypothetical protein